jgi:monoamine oxidase
MLHKYKDVTEPMQFPRDTVAVLGGGIAGLFAARELLRYGHKVVLIEAQNRLGGRVYPIQAQGIELQLGATYMHDTGSSKNPNMLISELKAENKLQTLGQAIQFDSPTITTISKNFEIFNSALEEMLNGCGADKLSPYNRDGLDGSYENGDDNFFLYDGYSALLKELELELTENKNCHVLKNKTIKKVEYDLEKKEHYLEIQDGMKLVCRGVICALPIGVLQGKSIEFKPPLPDLLDVVNPGSAIRFVMQFRDNFLEQECSHLIIHDDETNTVFRILNMDYYRKKKNGDLTASNCLAITYVPLDEKRAQLKPDVVMEKIKNCLRERYQPYDAVITAGLMVAEHDWGRDTYCMGGWSSFNETIIDKNSFDAWFFKINTYSESCNLYFAGEYMSQGGYGTVHGAALSGKQAALEFEKSLKTRARILSD